MRYAGIFLLASAHFDAITSSYGVRKRYVGVGHNRTVPRNEAGGPAREGLEQVSVASREDHEATGRNSVQVLDGGDPGLLTLAP